MIVGEEGVPVEEAEEESTETGAIVLETAVAEEEEEKVMVEGMPAMVANEKSAQRPLVMGGL